MQYKRFLSCLLGAALFLSCVKEVVSTVDPLPFPMDGNKDLSEATKAFAQEKLAAMQACVACPDEWFPETFPTLEEVSACNSFLEEYLLLRSRKLAYTLKLAG